MENELSAHKRTISIISIQKEEQEKIFKTHEDKEIEKLVDEHTAEDDIEVFFTEPGLDWISAHNFLTRLQKLSSYAFGHLEVSELVACLEKASFSCTSIHVKVF
ncbi:hypothetical protein Tco_0909007 [Tanacetum coccineum]|uniref:Uncharacterized protein n=1 Tax=Tanacetum coccineum TaxID=301880 RepID=A0ABQ5CQU2_9ASTR